MTAALEGCEWSASRPGHTLPPGKTRYPLHRRLGGPQGRSGQAENVVATGIRSRTVQPVVSHYTVWATGPTYRQQMSENYSSNYVLLDFTIIIKEKSRFPICNYRQQSGILCSLFRASLIYINNCPTRCNTKQSIYYSASSLYMFGVSTTPIIRNTQNCNYSLRYWSYFFCAATSL